MPAPSLTAKCAVAAVPARRDKKDQYAEHAAQKDELFDWVGFEKLLGRNIETQGTEDAEQDIGCLLYTSDAADE